jgi:hypothetical protein
MIYSWHTRLYIGEKPTSMDHLKEILKTVSCFSEIKEVKLWEKWTTSVY